MATALKKPARRVKGEVAKRKILEAALDVIAEKGLHGATHRDIAKKAEISLASTTYYFDGLDDLLTQALDLHIASGASELEAIHTKTMNRLKSFGDVASLTREQKIEAARAIARQIANYIKSQIAKGGRGIKVEAAFLYASNLPAELEMRVVAYRDMLVKLTQEFCAVFGDDHARVHAELLTGTILRLEFESINPAIAPKTKLIYEQLFMQLLSVMGVTPSKEG